LKGEAVNNVWRVMTRGARVFIYTHQCCITATEQEKRALARVTPKLTIPDMPVVSKNIWVGPFRW
jgi:hypothetical protein